MNNTGYLKCTVMKHSQNGQNKIPSSFVYECFSGVIPGEKVIDHIIKLLINKI